MKNMNGDDYYSSKIEFWEWQWLRGDSLDEQTTLAYILYYYKCVIHNLNAGKNV